MPKYSFKSDFSEGCHPQIMETLVRTNKSQQGAYGADEFSEQARNILKEKMNAPTAEVYFVSGGTQANLVAISAFLHTFEGVIAPATAHIFEHEAGAIEATGHRIDTIDKPDGKLEPTDIQRFADAYFPPHTVQPKLVYLTNSTEVGTIYTKKELTDIREICLKNNMYLYLDGARLGAALTAPSNDLTLADIARLCDAFYIGGTKNGALIGEAIVITNKRLQPGFASNIKQRGALLAKSRLLGIQFLELFRDNLFFELAAHANNMAQIMKAAFIKNRIRLLTDSPTNQLFVILPDTINEELSKKYDFYTFYRYDDTHSVARFVTSWATEEQAVRKFVQYLEELF